jgi:hypothetical protein
VKFPVAVAVLIRAAERIGIGTAEIIADTHAFSETAAGWYRVSV